MDATEGIAKPDLGTVLLGAVEEAARLLGADGGILYMRAAGTDRLRWTCDAGIRSAEDQARFRSLELPIGSGMFGTAFAERQVMMTGDYPADGRFPHDPNADQVVARVGIRSMVVAPLMAGDEPLGALGVFSHGPDAFAEQAMALIRALADHCASTVINVRLIEQLDHSRAELTRRAEAERTLRDITAGITSRDPDEVLQRVVDESRRLLGADGAHLCVLADPGDHLVPTVMAGATEAETREWLASERFPIDESMNGLAAKLGRAVRTTDYLVDPRVPHEADDQETAHRMGLRGMAVAPLRGVDGGILGTLAVSYTAPREVIDDELELLQGLADHAAIAVANARLLTELRESRERYRYLLRNSPDIAFSVDAEGRFTFLSEALEVLTGYTPEEGLGQSFLTLTMPAYHELLRRIWKEMSSPPFAEARARFEIPHKEGHGVPIELRSVPIVQDGRFMGAHGAGRDMRDQERLEQDLRRHAAELAAADERAHLARELHDSVTQALFSMTLTTRSIEMLIERDPGAAVERLAELRQLERDALAEMRALIFELRPGNLESDGLVQALRTLAAGIESRTGLPITVEAEAVERYAAPHENAASRVAQEAIHNVIKHASASRLRVTLGEREGELRLTVEDDGAGFDPSHVPAGHLGLAGMRTRAEQLGGWMHAASSPGTGTHIEVGLPIVRREGSPAPEPAPDVDRADAADVAGVDTEVPASSR